LEGRYSIICLNLVSIHLTWTIIISATDSNGLIQLSYAFPIDSSTQLDNQNVSQKILNEGGTTKNIIPLEGGQTDELGSVDTDGDGEFDDYDESYISIPPGSILGGKNGEADPNFNELSDLCVSISRKTPQGENTLSAQYDIQISDKKGNNINNAQINKNNPITVYLHYDINRFDGDISDLEIKYQDPNTNQWKTDGIKNVRILGNKIAFDVEHLTLFGIFASRPTGLTAMPSGNNDTIDLTWQDNSDSETGFEVYRKADGDPNFMLLEFTDSNICTYVDTNCLCDKTYLYKIRAATSFGPSEYSNKSSAAIPQYCWLKQ